MNRISRPQMFMEIAEVVAKRATCFRLNVGAVVVYDRRIISIGYNGAPPGAGHCKGHECPGANFCQRTIHAEINALSWIPLPMESEVRYDGCDMYVTDSPCDRCFAKIKNSLIINRLFFRHPYRVTDHLKGFPIYRVQPSGYVIDWETKQLVDIEA